MKRFLYQDLIEHLPKKQCTLLIGARQVGKTTLLRQVQDHLKAEGQPTYFLSLEHRQTLQLLNQDPNNLFQLIPAIATDSRVYVLMDEIQYLDDPSNFLKFHYDAYGQTLKFVVTGSSHFYIDKKFRDSMAGRKKIFELPTLGLEEVLHFRGRDDLAPYVGTQQIPLLLKDEIMQHFYDYLVYGGYPDVVLASSMSERKDILKELRNSYAKKDVQEAGLLHPDLYLRLMKISADQISSLLNVNALASNLGADHKTVSNYLWVMQKSFHIHCASPFHSRIASELRKMPKIFFADLGLRNSLLNNFSPIGARSDKGHLLENYVYLLFKRSMEEDQIKYWRTQNKQEVDFVVQRDNGTCRAYEVKWSPNPLQSPNYTYFRKTYPDIPLACIASSTAIETDPTRES